MMVYALRYSVIYDFLIVAAAGAEGPECLHLGSDLHQIR